MKCYCCVQLKCLNFVKMGFRMVFYANYQYFLFCVYWPGIDHSLYFLPVETKFKSYEYESITAVVSDMRLILENCYRYNGSSHWVSKIAHKLEKVLDQKLALLNRLVFNCVGYCIINCTRIVSVCDGMIHFSFFNVFL